VSPNFDVFSTLDAAVAVESYVDGVLGYPAAGVNVGRGMHVTSADGGTFVTQTVTARDV
jgi:hypothetical protein